MGIPDNAAYVHVRPPDECAPNYVYRGGSPHNISGKVNYYRGDHAKFSTSFKPNSWNFYLSSTLTLWNLDWNWQIFLFFPKMGVLWWTYLVDVLIKGGLLLAEIALGGSIDMVYST